MSEADRRHSQARWRAADTHTHHSRGHTNRLHIHTLHTHTSPQCCTIRKAMYSEFTMQHIEVKIVQNHSLELSPRQPSIPVSIQMDKKHIQAGVMQSISNHCDANVCFSARSPWFEHIYKSLFVNMWQQITDRRQNVQRALWLYARKCRRATFSIQ